MHSPEFDMSIEDRAAMHSDLIDLTLADKLFIAICKHSGLEILVLERYGEEVDVLPLRVV